MKIITLIVSLLVIGSTQIASAERWSSNGWVKLGETDVNGRRDRDRIDVGRHEGRFSKLTLVIENSEVEITDFVVTFSNGQRFNPRLRHRFREGARTRVIDLPGDERTIKSIDLRYKNVRGGGDARVEVWGWKTDGGKRQPPPRRDHRR